MSTTQLIQELKRDEYVLPKDILSKTSEPELIKQIEEIYSKHSDILRDQESFRSKYMELVSYLFFVNLARNKTHKKIRVFSDNLVQYLLAAPEKA